MSKKAVIGITIQNQLIFTHTKSSMLSYNCKLLNRRSERRVIKHENMFVFTYWRFCDGLVIVFFPVFVGWSSIGRCVVSGLWGQANKNINATKLQKLFL
jgi:hypothetical protein